MNRTAATLILGAGLALTACNPAPFIGESLVIENEAPTTTTTIPTRLVDGKSRIANYCQLVTRQHAGGAIVAEWIDGRQSPCDPANHDPFAYLDSTGWQGP